MVRKRGLEPPCLAAPDPKSGASASFATSAFGISSKYVSQYKQNCKHIIIKCSQA